MRKVLVVTMLTLGLAACATTAPPSVAKNTLPPRTTSAPATTTRAPSPSPSTVASSAVGSSGVPSAPPTPFERLPAGYSYAFLFKLTDVSGRWSVVLDPVTVCMYPSKDPHCSDVTAPPVNDYDIRTVSTKTYQVPLASGTTLSVIGPSGQPDDVVVVPMAEKTWATSSEGPQVIVQYATNAAGEISQIKEWWRP